MVKVAIMSGWAIRIQRKDGSSFIANGDKPGVPAFFTAHAAARDFVQRLREHKMRGRIVQARLTLEAE